MFYVVMFNLVWVCWVILLYIVFILLIVSSVMFVILFFSVVGLGLSFL